MSSILRGLITAAKRIVGMYPLYYNYRIRRFFSKSTVSEFGGKRKQKLRGHEGASAGQEPNHNAKQEARGAVAVDAGQTAARQSGKLLVLRRGYIRHSEERDLAATAKRLFNSGNRPLASAMLITKDRPQLAWRAVECFLAQSYANKELVIIDEGGTELQQKLKTIGSLAKHNIAYHRNERACSLGELRNRAVHLANGEFVCQWDDDDLYHKERLTYQLAACLAHQAAGSFLLRQLMYKHQGNGQELAISSHRLWEGTIIVRKSALSQYPQMARAEDTPVVNRLVWRHKVVGLDMPQLYIYNIHGGNTWHQEHMRKMWAAASVNLSPQEQARQLATLTNFYPQLIKHDSRYR